MKVIIALVMAVLAFVQASATQMAGNREIIVGGQPAPAGRYPYIVGLRSSSNSNPFCGGSLIAPSIVYTAGHCPSGSVVSVGCLAINGNCERIGVSSTIAHPNFVSSPVPQRDFRLVLLSGASTGSLMPFIADSSYASLPVGLDVTVIGYGTTSSGGSQPSQLMEVEVDVVSNADCSADYAGTGAVVDSTMICASRTGKDSCQGDSGGPLFVRCDATGKDVQVGIVSWGIGCADPDFPGVYSRVSAGDSFLKGQLASLGASVATPPPVSNICASGPTTQPSPTPAPVPVVVPTPAPTPSCIFFC